MRERRARSKWLALIRPSGTFSPWGRRGVGPQTASPTRGKSAVVLLCRSLGRGAGKCRDDVMLNDAFQRPVQRSSTGNSGFSARMIGTFTRVGLAGSLIALPTPAALRKIGLSADQSPVLMCASQARPALFQARGKPFSDSPPGKGSRPSSTRHRSRLAATPRGVADDGTA